VVDEFGLHRLERRYREPLSDPERRGQPEKQSRTHGVDESERGQRERSDGHQGLPDEQ
jgi:hypothetical protein